MHHTAREFLKLVPSLTCTLEFFQISRALLTIGITCVISLGEGFELAFAPTPDSSNLVVVRARGSAANMKKGISVRGLMERFRAGDAANRLSGIPSFDARGRSSMESTRYRICAPVFCGGRSLL